MNIDAFIKEIENIKWLENACNISSVLETEYEWDWLPTSRDQENPFQSDIENNVEVKEEINKVYKATLKSLRSVGEKHPHLQNGAHDYTEAFKGAVLFACENAAREYLHNTNGKWTEIIKLYKEGRWPCGLKNNGSVVVL